LRTVLVLSLKGGTGKSTIASFLSVYNAQTNPTVLIDADVDSPNIAEILKIDETLRVEPDRIEVFHSENLDVFSMGLITRDKAISMRGDSYVQILLDVVNMADWRVNTKDAMCVIDCPAGASDLLKGVIRAFYDTIVGAVVVAIPSATNDLKRMLKILNHYGVPVFGVVENMAYFECEHGAKYYFFDNGRVAEICAEYGVDYLGEVPISKEIADLVSAGVPYIPEGIEPIFSQITTKVAETKPVGASLLDRITKKVSDKVKRTMAKIMVSTILKINKEIDLKEITSKGFGGKVIEFIITSEGDEITKAYLRLEKNRLIALRSVSKVDLTIMADVNTLLDVAKGKTDLETAFYFGDIEVFGVGGTTRAFSFFQKIWDVMKDEIIEKVEVEEV